MNSVTKNNIILKNSWTQTHYLLHERQRLYHCSTETQLTKKTVKLILIHATVDSLNSLNSANSAPFRKNPIVFMTPEVSLTILKTKNGQIKCWNFLMRWMLPICGNGECENCSRLNKWKALVGQ